MVRAVETGLARADDAEILSRAIQEHRTLVTLDQHFGDWVVLPLSEHFGVIRVKAHPSSSENVASVLVPLLASREQSEFRNQLVIASVGRLRWIRTSG